MEQEFISEWGQRYKPMYEYKGFTVFKGDNPILSKDCNYVDAHGKTVNAKEPLFSSCVKKGNRYNNIHSSMFGGDGKDPAYSDTDYTKKQIDDYLERRKERILESFKKHRSGKVRKYILDNVVITVIYLEGEFKDIYVNERPLRRVNLRYDFTFKDVLCQVYLKTIAKYNVTALKDLRIPAYIKDIQEETIKLSVLPLYEYIGLVVEWNKEQYIIRDVWDYYYNDKADFRLLTDKGDLLIKVEDIPNLKVLGEHKGEYQISCLINKLNFYE
jgi:hypothetical protein